MSTYHRRHPDESEPRPNIPTLTDAQRDAQREQAEEVPDFLVIETMRAYGGGFVYALADAARHADYANIQRLKAAWPEYWSQYSQMWRQLNPPAE